MKDTNGQVRVVTQIRVDRRLTFGDLRVLREADVTKMAQMIEDAAPIRGEASKWPVYGTIELTFRGGKTTRLEIYSGRKAMIIADGDGKYRTIDDSDEFLKIIERANRIAAHPPVKTDK